MRLPRIRNAIAEIVVISGRSCRLGKPGAGGGGIVWGGDNEQAMVEGVLAGGKASHLDMTALNGSLTNVDAHTINNGRLAYKRSLVTRALDRCVDCVQFTQQP